MTEEPNEPKVRPNEAALRLLKEGAPSGFPAERISAAHLKRTHEARLLRNGGRIVRD